MIRDAAKNSLDEAVRNTLGQHYRGKIYYKSDRISDLVKKMITGIEEMRWQYRMEEEEETGGCSWYILERAVGKKAWIQGGFNEKAIWGYDKAVAGQKPKVVTFYSFKGGMGRTTALAATALYLAQMGKNILMIDTDLEAPGLSSLFKDESNTAFGGTVDYLLESNLNSNALDMADYIQQINDPVFMADIPGNLFMISAGVMQEDYLQKLARIDFQDSMHGKLKEQICNLVEEAVLRIEEDYKVDYVFLDARAGFHDMGGIVTTQIPHGVVVFGKDSRQSWQGIEMVIKAISEVQQDCPLLAIVDSACGQNGIVTPEEREIFNNQSYAIFSDSYYLQQETPPGKDAVNEAHSPIYIPYHPALSAGIQLYTTGNEREGAILAQVKAILSGNGYQELGKRICGWFGDEEGRNE